MEVHAHPHTPRKKWTHYFWEFFMLFLAVFCGFLAEYQLEHIIEHDREKQYIHSLIADLKENDRLLNESLSHQEKRMKLMDSMIILLKDPAGLKGREGLLYYQARLSPRTQPVTVNAKTFEQLKNSGNFRLIRKIETSNKIMSYYEKLPLLRMLEELYQKEFEQYKILASKIFDPAVFFNMETPESKIVRTSSNPPLQSYEPSLIKQFNVFAVYMNGSARGLLTQIEQIKKDGKELLVYLQNEYRLK